MDESSDKIRQTPSNRGSLSPQSDKVSSSSSSQSSAMNEGGASSSVVKEKSSSFFHGLLDMFDIFSKSQGKDETEVKQPVFPQKQIELPRDTVPSSEKKTSIDRPITFIPAGAILAEYATSPCEENRKKGKVLSRNLNCQSNTVRTGRGYRRDRAEKGHFSNHTMQSQTLSNNRNKVSKLESSRDLCAAEKFVGEGAVIADSEKKLSPSKVAQMLSKDNNKIRNIAEKVHPGKLDTSIDATNRVKYTNFVDYPDSGKNLSNSGEQEMYNSKLRSSSGCTADEKYKPVVKSPSEYIKTSASETRKVDFHNGMIQKIVGSLNKSSTSKLDRMRGRPSIPNHNLARKSSQMEEFDELSPTGFKLFKKSIVARTLVHGEVRFRPLESVAQANFSQDIHRALERLNIENPYRIQMYSWPAISHGHSIVLVGPPKSGKSLSYIVPLVSFMLQPNVYSELQPGNGPLVLILCSGSKSAEFIYKQCNALLQLSGHEQVRVKIACGSGRENELRDYLANGTEILISTPLCYWHLLQWSNFITNLDRLAHLVIDEIDVLAEKFLPEMKKIIIECKKVLQRRSKLVLPIQLIATSERWCPAVEQFSKFVSEEFVICISGYLEAAVYAKLRPTLHFLNEESKAKTLINILDGNRGLYKTIVACNTVDEIELLCPFLKAECLLFLIAHEFESPSKNKDTFFDWKNSRPGFHPILVCTDAVLPDLNAYDAMWLIHYSLPATKTKFGYRFSCLMNNYRNMFQTSTKKDDKPDCTVDIFMDQDGDNKQLPEVVQLMKRLSVPVSAEIEKKAEMILNQKEYQKNTALCNRMKAFGECPVKNTCPNRHVVMNSADKPSTNIPQNGIVKLKILHIHDASRFSARLLEYTGKDGKKVKVSNDYFITNISVNKHYMDEKNRRAHGFPKLGDCCGFESKINVFQRVRVVEVVKEDLSGKPDEVRVYFPDEGIFKEIKVYQLLSLPNKLQQMTSNVLEVFLCNIKPCDLDTNWSLTANHFMYNCIKKVNDGDKEGKFVLGKVVLHLENTVWVDPLKCCSFLESMNTTVTELSFTKELLNSKLAVNNVNHVSNLLKLCDGVLDAFSKEVASETATSSSNEACSVRKTNVAQSEVTLSKVPKRKSYEELLDLLEDETNDHSIESESSSIKTPDINSSISSNPNLGASFDTLDDFITDVKETETKVIAEESHVGKFDGMDDFENKSESNANSGHYSEQESRIEIEEGLDSSQISEKDVNRSDEDTDSEDELECGYDSNETEDEYDIVIDDVHDFITKMAGLDETQAAFLKLLIDAQQHNSVAAENGAGVLERQSVPALLPPEPTDRMVTSSLAGSVSSLDVSSEIDAAGTEHIPLLMSTTKSPDVLWYQDYSSVSIKIKLIGVEDYYIALDLTHLKFFTQQNNNIYEVQGELFGPVQVSDVRHLATGLLFQIKLKKAVPGVLWPRLFQSKAKLPWLKYDCEKYNESFNIDVDVAERCERAIEELALGEIKKGRKIDREAAVIVPELMSSDDDEDYEEEESSELFEESYDPYDPLS